MVRFLVKITKANIREAMILIGVRLAHAKPVAGYTYSHKKIGEEDCFEPVNTLCSNTDDEMQPGPSQKTSSNIKSRSNTLPNELPSSQSEKLRELNQLEIAQSKLKQRIAKLKREINQTESLKSSTVGSKRLR